MKMRYKAFLIYSGALVTFLFLLLATSAQSQESGWLPRKWQGQYQRHKYPSSRFREPQRYYRGIEETSFREAREARRCLGRLFSDKGRELASEESALKDAERSWGALIREERGEKYMDLKYAARYESRCQRSSTGESITAKTLEAITGGVTGILYRCRIYAEPCMAPRIADEKRND